MYFVFDSGAFINGAQHHYFLDTMAPVWGLVETSIDDGRIVVPREVYREVRAQEDAISDLVHRHDAVVVEPSEQVQILAGEYQAKYFKTGLRDRADPFVMAEAKLRSATVVTYEGITFSGKPARGAERKLPGLCREEKIAVCTLPQALQLLGLKLS